MQRLRGLMSTKKQSLLEGELSPEATTDLADFTTLPNDTLNKKSSAAAAYQKKVNAPTNETKADPTKKEQALLNIGLRQTRKSPEQYIQEQNSFMLEAALNGATPHEIRAAGQKLDDDEWVKSAIINIAAKIELKQLDRFRELFRSEQAVQKQSTLQPLPSRACVPSSQMGLYQPPKEVDLLTGPSNLPKKELDLLTPSDPLNDLFAGMSINNGPVR